MKLDEVKLKQLEDKRQEMLNAIEPICKAFNIKDYDYYIYCNLSTGVYDEYLVLENTQICCTLNSEIAVIDEIIGWLFVNSFCKNRSIGRYKENTLKYVRRHWKGYKSMSF